MLLLLLSHSQEKRFKKGVQLYKCHACGNRITNGERLNSIHLWILYVRGKQTYKESATSFGVSESDIKTESKKCSSLQLIESVTR